MHAPAAHAEAPATRVRVGPAEDEAEHAADRVAEMLVAPARPLCTACAAGAEPCPACAGGARKLRRSALGPAPAAAAPILRGPGAPLPAATRAKFEARLGADLSPIRLHAGAEAARAARAVNARAFAHGRDIALGDRAPPPHSAEGERLLAHEVAHTLQDGAAGTLRRRTDYTIVGLSPGAVGDAATIYFDYASASLAASEQAKIPALATPPSRALTLFGYSSEEGTPAQRTAMVGRRLGAVGTALANAGHAAARSLTPEISRGEGNIDYRSMRSVAVVPTPGGGGAAVSPLGSGTCTTVIPCGTAFTTAHPVATTQLAAAITHVAAPTAAATAQLGTLFPGVPAAQVQTGLTGLATELARMPANHVCHDYPCDARCDRPAYASPGTRVMTLCPGFIKGGPVQENAALLLHEGLHMVPGLTTRDFAYRRSRFIDFIPGAQAATNTDSFVLLILRLGSSTAAGPASDAVSGLAPAEQNAARRSLAFAEQWLLTADWDTSQLYESIKVNKGRAGGWDPAHAHHAGTQHVMGWIFGLTDPGAAPPYATSPTQEDQEKVAGINDRYKRMMRALWTRPLTVTSSAAGPEGFSGPLGAALVVQPAFFALGPADQVVRVVELMAASLPAADIPAGRRRDYATAAQQVWWHAGRTGP